MRLLLVLTLLLLPAAASTEDLRARIAVVDTGINVSDTAIQPYLCESGHVDLTGKGIADHYGHGTNVAFIIARGMDPKRQCLVVVKWYDTSANKDANPDEVVSAAVATGAKLVNMSYGGRPDSMLEDGAVRHGLDRGVTFVMAAGNDGQDLDARCDYYPACSFAGVPNVHVVGALDGKGKRASFSNYGRLVSNWAPGTDVMAGGRTMSGTSQAAAAYTASLAKTLR